MEGWHSIFNVSFGTSKYNFPHHVLMPIEKRRSGILLNKYRDYWRKDLLKNKHIRFEEALYNFYNRVNTMFSVKYTNN